MIASDLPRRLSTPFAQTGGRNVVPVASQIAVTPGAASYADGFPPVTRIRRAAGGAAPAGLDFNGVMFDVSAAIRWAQAGGPNLFNAAFCTAIGGYPRGATLISTASNSIWMSTADNNLTDPDSAGAANWVRFSGGIVYVTEPELQQERVDRNAGDTANYNYANATFPSFPTFAASGGSYGYQKLPSGMIFQWGVGVTNTGVDIFNFPIAFPNTCISIVANEGAASGWTTFFTVFGTTPINRVGFLLTCAQVPNSGGFIAGAGVTYNWLAVGY